MKNVGLTLAAAALLTLVALPALGHVSVDPEEVPVDATEKMALRVGHGCDGSPTTRVTVDVPSRVTSLAPRPKPGWELTVTQEGDEVTAVTWEGGSLPDGQMDEFAFTVRLVGEPGEQVYFPVVQECEEGEHAWIQIPADDEGHEDLAEPAPGVRLAGEANAESEPSVRGMVVVALVLGGLGTVLGVTALVVARR